MLIVYITAWIASQGENNTLGSWLDRKWLLGSLLSLKFLYKQFHTSIHFMQLPNSDDQYPPNIGLLANLFSINVFLSQNLSIPFLLVSFYRLPIWVFFIIIIWESESLGWVATHLNVVELLFTFLLSALLLNPPFPSPKQQFHFQWKQRSCNNPVTCNFQMLCL